MRGTDKQIKYAQDIIASKDKWIEQDGLRYLSIAELNGWALDDLREAWEQAKEIISEQLGARGWIELKDASVLTLVNAPKAVAMPILEGTPKQIAFANALRVQKVLEIVDIIKPDFVGEMIAELSKETSAKAWIECPAMTLKISADQAIKEAREVAARKAVEELKAREESDPEFSAKSAELKAKSEKLSKYVADYWGDVCMSIVRKNAAYQRNIARKALMALDIDSALEAVNAGLKLFEDEIASKNNKAKMHAIYVALEAAEPELRAQAQPYYDAAKQEMEQTGRNRPSVTANMNKCREILGLVDEQTEQASDEDAEQPHSRNECIIVTLAQSAADACASGDEQQIRRCLARVEEKLDIANQNGAKQVAEQLAECREDLITSLKAVQED